MLRIGIITQSPEVQINLDRDLYIKLAKEFKKIYIIDLSFKNKKKIKLPKNFVFLKPKNTEDVKKIFSKKKFLCFNFLAFNYSNLRLLFLLKKFEIKHFYLMRSGTIKMNEDLFIKKNNRLNFYFIFLRKIFFKILIIFKFIYNYEILFISQKVKKIFYHSKRNQFLNKLFNTNKFFLYNKIIEINDKTYDLNYKHKNSKTSKIIAFIDTTLNQPGKISSIHKPNEKQKIIFYEKLRNFLKLLSKKYKMKLFICLHPKTSKKEENIYFKGIRCQRYKTSEIIKKSYLNIYLSSTLISESIYLRKNIILIKSKLLGNFHSYRVNRLIEKFKLNYIDLDITRPYNSIKDLKFLSENKSLTFKILSKEINISQKETGIQRVIKALKDKKIYKR